MLKYNICGNDNGQTILFINGAGVGKWMWKEQLNYFSDFKCITFDLPGHGENSDIEFTTIDSCCKNIKEIILKESGSKKAILIGLSIGAQIILNMLEHYENVLEKCIVISALNKPMKVANSLLKLMVACCMPLVKMRSFSKLQAKQLALPYSMFELYYNDSLRISKAGFCNILSENMNFSFKNLNKTKIEILILVGEKEKKVMIDSAQSIHEMIPSSLAYIIKDAAHGIPYEKSELFNQMVYSFIANDKIDETKMEAL